MKIVKSIATLFFVIILGALVYFFVYKAEEAKRAELEGERRLIRFNLDRINSFKLARPDSSIVFEKSMGRIWNITEPIQTEADGTPLYRLFNSLDQSDILYNVEDKPKDIEPYGLQNPPYYMAMLYDNDDQDTLFVGNDTPDGTMAYVRFSSEDRVLAVTNQLTELIKKPIVSYRSRTLLNVFDDDITSIEIFRNAGENEEKIQIDHNGMSWFMTEPWDFRADQKNIDELRKKLGESRKKSLEVEKADDLSVYGLDSPTTIVKVSLKYGMPDKMLIIGDRLTEKGKSSLWYAKRFDKDLIFTMENSLVTLLTRPRVWFIEKNPFPFNRNLVNRVVLETGKETITFSMNQQGNWSVISPLDKNIEQGTINSIYAISRFLLMKDIETLDAAAEDMEKTGLDQPSAIITFYNNTQKISRAIYGNTFVTDEALTYVMSDTAPIIYITRSQVSRNINQVLDAVFGN